MCGRRHTHSGTFLQRPELLGTLQRQVPRCQCCCAPETGPNTGATYNSPRADRCCYGPVAAAHRQHVVHGHPHRQLRAVLVHAPPLPHPILPHAAASHAVRPHSGVLKEQLNLEEHPPGCHMLMDNNGESNDTLNLTSEPEPEPYLGLMAYPEPEAEPLPEGSTDEFGRRVTCKGPPIFDTHAVEVWVWLVGPFCLYCAERVYRLVRSNTPAAVHRIIEHPNDVVELQLTKEGFTAKPGQYVVVNCPDVSTLEYHPFTLTMCPSSTDPTFSIHLQKMGDWTESLYDRLLPDPDETDESLPVMVHRQYPILYIDGPFGSPSENVFHYDVSLCIAGGIGITPFASVLNHLLNEGTTSSRLRRLYLIWVCKNITSFLWIAQVLSALQRQAWNENRPDFLNIYLHLTRSRDVQIMEREYPFLNSRLHVGRPQWRHIFDEVARYNPSTTVGVFLCGPKGMSKGIKRICLKKNKFHTKFEFHKENF
ncbi:NADPH oxidase 4-like isoform X2 [Branchiostoma floridae x Branchiostoma belcheri]